MQQGVAITKRSHVSLFVGQLYLGEVQLGVAITNYKVSHVSPFGGQLQLRTTRCASLVVSCIYLGEVQLGVVAIRNYMVSHDHLPASHPRLILSASLKEHKCPTRAS